MRKNTFKLNNYLRVVFIWVIPVLFISILFSGCKKDEEVSPSIEGIWEINSYTSNGIDFLNTFGFEKGFFEFTNSEELTTFLVKVSDPPVMGKWQYSYSISSGEISMINASSTLLGSVSGDGQMILIEGESDTGTPFEIELSRTVIDLCAAINCPNNPCFYGECLDLQQWLDEGSDPLQILEFISDLEAEAFYGKEYQGGLIFFLDVNDEYDFDGLIVAEDEVFPRPVLWGCMNIFIATPMAVGYGKINSQTVYNQGCLSSSHAIAKVHTLQQNGYSDWFVPSVDEWRLISLNLVGEGHLGFVGQNYWTSCGDNTGERAYIWSPAAGSRGWVQRDYNANVYVRPVREF